MRYTYIRIVSFIAIIYVIESIFLSPENNIIIVRSKFLNVASTRWPWYIPRWLCVSLHRSNSRVTYYIYGCAHTLMATCVHLKIRICICTHSRRASARFHPGKATETLCKWVFAGRTFVGNEERRRERWERMAEKGKEKWRERGLLRGLKRGESVSSAFSRRGIGQEPGSFLPKLNRKLDSH